MFHVGDEGMSDEDDWARAVVSIRAHAEQQAEAPVAAMLDACAMMCSDDADVEAACRRLRQSATMFAAARAGLAN